MSSADPNRNPILGCIADDVTGATDLAINLVQGGMKVVQVMGVPTQDTLGNLDADAVVVALKTRSVEASDAVAQSLATLDELRQRGIERFFFKYCSTFDSTSSGNIGPVAEALLDRLGERQCIFCPAFPRNGRTVYRGHLFVGNALLNESGMEHHPLNPMTDANLVRFLSQQTSQNVGLLDYDSINEGSEAARRSLDRLLSDGVRMVVTDACDDSQLKVLAEVVAADRLATGGSGIARYLPEAYRESGSLVSVSSEPGLPAVEGRGLVLAGSCSEATNRQVAVMRQLCPAFPVDVSALMSDFDASLAAVVGWAEQQASASTLMIYSTANPDAVREQQAAHGAEAVANRIEAFMSSIAQTLVSRFDFSKLVLAGGETSGAVVNGLDIRALRIGPEICAGVPWTETIEGKHLALALKSGNFGSDDFFEEALSMLSGVAH